MHARRNIVGYNNTVAADAQAQWNEVIDRRSREMAAGRMDARPEEEVIRGIRAKLHARRQSKR